MTLEEQVRAAVAGDRKALEVVLEAVQGRIYNLALRMLWQPEDAQDATQEILIKLITHLSRFEHRSAFTTWVYRLATHELLNYRKKHARHRLSFEAFGDQLEAGISEPEAAVPSAVEEKLLLQEAKIGCSLAMLQCLDEEGRAAYLIGEVLGFQGPEAAYILDVSPEVYRKRLSRSRQRVQSFVRQHCGLVNPQNPCRCQRQIAPNVKRGNIDPQHLLFTREDEAYPMMDWVDSMSDEVALFRSTPEYQIPGSLMQQVKKWLQKPIP
ncbi:MAG: RNA polymerase sigma factor [Bacteroidota bacterium]